MNGGALWVIDPGTQQTLEGWCCAIMRGDGEQCALLAGDSAVQRNAGILPTAGGSSQRGGLRTTTPTAGCTSQRGDLCYSPPGDGAHELDTVDGLGNQVPNLFAVVGVILMVAKP